MVGKMYSHWKKLLVVFSLMLLVCLLSSTAAPAQEIGEEGYYAIEEEYLIELNDVGDAHITDTITYDTAWFDEYGYLFEENPNLLSRRYRADTYVGEAENFDVDIDAGRATITVSFDTPGLAYNLDDGWTVYGYGEYYTLADEGDDEMVLEAAWTVTSEFTLFDPMSVEETVIIDLPEGAHGASYDEGNGAITYDLTYITAGEGVLAENKTLFTIIFACIMALSLFLALYVFTRKTAAPLPAATVPPAQPVAPGAPTPTPASPVQPAAPQPAPPMAPAGAPDEAVPRFCKKCGSPRADMEERFCRKCGATFE